MKSKTGYFMIVFLAFVLYLWTNVAATFYALLFLIAFAILMWVGNLIAVRSVRVEVSVTGGSEQSTERVYRLQVLAKNAGVLPVFRLIVRGSLFNCLTDSKMEYTREISLAPFGEKQLEIPFESTFCGRIEGEIKEVVVSDFLGIFRRKVSGNRLAVCYAYPIGAETGEYDIDLSAPDEHNIQNRYLNRKGNDITEILDIRDYQKGDSIKTIHWKLSKKMGRKVVRELDTPANQEIILLTALSEQQLENPEMKDRLVETASSISTALLEEEKFYDAVVFERDGGASHKYSVEEVYTRDLYERTMLDGDVNFRQQAVEGYIRSHNVLNKYAFVILITDRELAGWFAENANVRQVFVMA